MPRIPGDEKSLQDKNRKLLAVLNISQPLNTFTEAERDELRWCLQDIIAQVNEEGNGAINYFIYID